MPGGGGIANAHVQLSYDRASYTTSTVFGSDAPIFSELLAFEVRSALHSSESLEECLHDVCSQQHDCLPVFCERARACLCVWGGDGGLVDLHAAVFYILQGSRLTLHLI